MQLGPNIPSIWVRAANLHYQAGEPEEALRCWIHALDLVPDFDDVVFSYFDRLAADPLPALNSRARQSYLRHLLGTSQLEKVEEAWPRVPQTDALAAEYVSFLVGHGKPLQAAQAWASYKGTPLQPIFNGGFELAPMASPFDWTISPTDGADAARDNTQAYGGRWSLRINFRGEANVDYHHTSQQAYVAAGRYRFCAMVKTRDITTDQGIRFRIGSVATDQLIGTNDWTPIEANLDLPTGLISIQICRNASQRFDNKISGTVWVDAVTLVHR